MSKRNQDVTQSRNDHFPRNVSSAGRQSLHASVISRHSFRRESVGSNVLIIVGLTLSFSGVAMTMTGVYAEFAHTETKLTILGIGPSLIGIGIFFLLLRLFFCRPHICGCCREVKQLFSTNNTITPCTSCRGPLSRTTSVKSTGEKTTFCSPRCSEITVKPAIRSSNRSVTSGKVNFLPGNEEKNVDTRNNLLDEKRENNTAGQSGSDTTRPNTEERFVSVISASRKQEIKSGKNDESRLNVGSKPTTSSSMNFLDELGEI
ncbi:uncharacterized protein LOC143244486 isoform X1 [Tachypleus tridentatus]|uniref:uncharacterized protein LOC143244486 isoform X1 n=1 Tax=Tachypleus tridentatus TaxID=6853 RepID=UPI003FCFCF88